jgi:azurin
MIAATRTIAFGLGLSCAVAGARAQEPSPPPRTVEITMRGGMRFEPASFEAKPGEELVIAVKNLDYQPHNFALLKPGTREDVVRVATMLDAHRGAANDWVPSHPAILAHTALVSQNRGPGAQSVELRVRLPKTRGVYPFVCTIPGHGAFMYGAIYVGVSSEKAETGRVAPVVPTNIAGEGRRPFVQRIYMPDASPAAIAVSLPGKSQENYCWDAAESRLRYVWRGPFIDAAVHWASQGTKLARFDSTPWWRAPKGEFPLRFETSDSPAPTTQFLGYRTTPVGPEFHYRAGTAEVFERITARRAGSGIDVHMRIVGATGPVFYRAGSDSTVRWTSSTGTWSGDTLALTRVQAADFTVSLVPVGK